MRLVIQRVKSARLCVDNKLISEIGVGLIVFAGVMKGDTITEVKKAANKISTIRIFEEDDKMNKSYMMLADKFFLFLTSHFAQKKQAGLGQILHCRQIEMLLKIYMNNWQAN